MGKMLRRSGSTATLVWIVLAVSTPRGINADAAEDCPEFASSLTVVQTAPDCAAEVDIPYKLQSTSWKSVEVTILDENAAEKNTRPPGSSIEIRKQFGELIEDSPFAKSLGFVAKVKWTPRLEHAALSLAADGRAPKVWTLLISSTTTTCRKLAHKLEFKVWKCEYCINEKDSMHSIAARFSTHWTQIWSSNHQIDSPDQLVTGQRIQLGNIYETVKGDTWNLMAVRFGTTVDRLLTLNPDLAKPPSSSSQADQYLVNIVPQNSLVCVVPDTCPERRKSSPGVTW